MRTVTACEVPLTEKFTYFDFQMYVLPGAILLSGLLAGWAVAGGAMPTLLGDSGLFASVVFVLGAFVAGHFVQTVAHSWPERILKSLFWAGRYPSQIILFRGHGLISATERQRFIDTLKTAGLADEDLVEAWDAGLTIGWFRRKVVADSAEQFTRGVEGAQSAFNQLRHLLSGADASTRVASAEASYQFFRGGFVAAGLAALLLAAESVALTQTWLAAPVDTSVLGTIVSATFFVLCLAFFWRARGAGQNFAREVFRAYAATASRQETALGDGN